YPHGNLGRPAAKPHSAAGRAPASCGRPSSSADEDEGRPVEWVAITARRRLVRFPFALALDVAEYVAEPAWRAQMGLGGLEHRAVAEVRADGWLGGLLAEQQERGTRREEAGDVGRLPGGGRERLSADRRSAEGRMIGHADRVADDQGALGDAARPRAAQEPEE